MVPFVCCWQEWKLVKMLWKAAWQLLLKLIISIPYDSTLSYISDRNAHICSSKDVWECSDETCSSQYRFLKTVWCIIYIYFPSTQSEKMALIYIDGIQDSTNLVTFRVEGRGKSLSGRGPLRCWWWSFSWPGHWLNGCAHFEIMNRVVHLWPIHFLFRYILLSLIF